MTILTQLLIAETWLPVEVWESPFRIRPCVEYMSVSLEYKRTIVLVIISISGSLWPYKYQPQYKMPQLDGVERARSFGGHEALLQPLSEPPCRSFFPLNSRHSI